MDYITNNPFWKWILTNNRRAELDSLLNNPLIWII